MANKMSGGRTNVELRRMKMPSGKMGRREQLATVGKSIQDHGGPVKVISQRMKQEGFNSSVEQRHIKVKKLRQ